MLYAECMVGETGQNLHGPQLAARFVGFTILLIVASVVIARLFAWLFGGDLSAWVQAVGAILAILSGFATTALQTEAQRQLDEKMRRRWDRSRALCMCSHSRPFRP